MTGWRAFTCSLTDGELLATARALVTLPFAFVEGPTRSAFVLSAEVGSVEDLWQLRLFEEEAELAARRLDFSSDEPWMARMISTAQFQLPAGWESVHPVDLPDPEEQTVVMYGKANGHGRFEEGRFRKPRRGRDGRSSASWEYPPFREWEESQEAELVMAVHPCPDGAVVRWASFRARPRTARRSG